ncbi:hypothetical protein RQP46_005338 [Phenoliferia psychrophenolica]
MSAALPYRPAEALTSCRCQVLSLRTVAVALFASAIGALAASSHHGAVHVQKRDVVSSLTTVTTTVSTKVNGTLATVKNVLATVDSLGVDGVLSEVNSAVSELTTVVNAAVSDVEGIIADVVDALEGDTAPIAADLASSIATVEALISYLEQQLYNIPALSVPILALSQLVDSPLSTLLSTIDSVLDGVLALVGTLLKDLGLGSLIANLVVFLNL